MLLSLQYLRGVAALLVVYFHSLTQLKNAGHKDIYLPVIGESGVDLFFVLSGFVMWLTTANRKIGPVEFIVKRVKRIVPIYWILTLSATLLALSFGDLMKSTVFDVPHLVKSLLFIPAYNPAPAISGIYPVIIPGWTLNFEFFFYLIFSFSLFCKVEKKRLRLISSIVFCCFFLSFYVKSDIAIISFYLNNVVIEFLFGVFLAVIFLKKEGGKKIGHKFLIIFILISFLALLYADYAFHGLRSLALGVPSALIIYWLIYYEKSHSIFYSKILKKIGDSSYSIYLTHIFALAFLRVIFQLNGVKLNEIDPILFVFLSLFLSSICGLLFYRIIEKPIIDFIR